jgi:site-specific DNA-methyltransferase (adenine-specific)
VIAPYWSDDEAGLQLYLGDMRDVLPELGLQADLIVADPPFGETSLDWDRWPTGWLKVAAAHSNALWCFGSQRMFFDHLDEFRADWTLSQDVIGHDETGTPVHGDVNVVWEKHNGTGFAKDRFKRVHEHALFWYRGPWEAQHRAVPVEKSGRRGGGEGGLRATDTAREHTRKIAAKEWNGSDGRRLMRSVIKVRNMQGLQPINKTQKPLGIVEPLIHYACPPGGLIVDPMAGSCVVLEVARLMGLRAIAIEKRESQCEAAVRRLSALTLPT